MMIYGKYINTKTENLIIALYIAWAERGKKVKNSYLDYFIGQDKFLFSN